MTNQGINAKDYISNIPNGIPDGKILVHNQVPWRGKLGLDGFQAWITEPDEKSYVLCFCDWAKELGFHHRVRANWDRETSSSNN